MKYSWFALPLLLATARAVPAQQPLITPETPVNSSILEQWLHSGDPRLIAWAADFARRTHDTSIVREMPELLEHWTIPQPYIVDESQAAQRRAVIAVLDTLIQERVQVPIPAIKAVAQFFPSQAAILISRIPLPESRVTLNGWTDGATGSWSGHTLARVASMMLAKDPESSFVARVVAESEEDLEISVRSGRAGYGIGSGTCGDSLGTPVSPGWPEVYTYDLVENDPNAYSSPVIDLDGDRIAFWRFKENGGWGSCSGEEVEDLDPRTRHRLIAHWLGVQGKDMRWKPVEQISIIWTNKAAYQQRLGALIELQRQKLRATVETLRQRGFLTESQAKTTAPRLVVTIKCEMKPCPLI